MATNLNPTPEMLDARQCLAESEQAYFTAGAHNRPICGGTLSVVPGLQHLPAGCVLHSVLTPPRPGDLVHWLRTLERAFMRVGSRLSRLYLPESADDLVDGLSGFGYRPREEAGYARDFAGDCSWITRHLNLRPLDPARDWTHKIQLCIQAGVGPDGYDMRHGAYATLERAKCEAGYMRSFLYWMGDRAVGSVSLSVHGGFARLKNVLVHPEFRGRGVGRAMVIGLMAEARREGASLFGVFGATPATRRLYESCGLLRLMRQTEWSRSL
jgi:GNAT superfamily N-acetyltransferase